VSLIVWGCWLTLFCILEGLAALGVVPWDTFSRTVWNLQTRYGAPVTLGVLFVLSVLLAHLVRYRNLSEGDEEKEPR
jgi:hypothetical protein